MRDRYYYCNSELTISYDNDGKVNFIEFLGGIDKATEYDFNCPPCTDRPVAGCYRIEIDAHERIDVACVVELTEPIPDTGASGEKYIDAEFIKDDTILTIGMEDENPAFESVRIENGLQYKLLQPVDKIVFGIAWATDYKGADDVRTWYAADPTIVSGWRCKSMESIIFRIMNLKELHKLEEEIEKMSDSQEREARTRLIEQIVEKITDYDVHVREYAYQQAVQALIDRGIILEPVAREPIITKWDNHFDSLVSAEVKQAAKHYTNQFRWHLFSFELLPAVQGDQARTAFHEIEKGELYLFFDYADETYRVKNAHLLTADDIEILRENSSLDLSDMYFYDPLNKWTYIKPHEEYCGPYFFKVE